MLLNYNNKDFVSLSLSDEAYTGSGGDRPVRNNLTEWNGKGGHNFLLPFFLFQSFMPKKTPCFDRNKREKLTFINPKKGQRISGQDRRSWEEKNADLISELYEKKCNFAVVKLE